VTRQLYEAVHPYIYISSTPSHILQYKQY